MHNECSKTTCISADNPQRLAEVVKNTVANQCEYTADGVKIIGNIDLNATLSAVLEAGVKILSINCSETSFEDYYLSLIGGASL